MLTRCGFWRVLRFAPCSPDVGVGGCYVQATLKAPLRDLAVATPALKDGKAKPGFVVLGVGVGQIIRLSDMQAAS